MSPLNQFTPWQWELAFTASRLQLGLLNTDQMIAFTHKLMDNGYYDDVMLDIIDDNPLYNFKENNYIKAKFIQLWKYLNLATINNEQARYLFTYLLFHPFTVRPFNICTYNTEEIAYFLIVEYADNLIDYLTIKETFYLRELPLNDINWENKPPHYVSYNEMAIANTNFFLACENWLAQNQAKILQILQHLFPQKTL